MNIDWIVLAQVATPIIAVLIGASLNQYFRQKEKLIAFYGHIASHAVNSVIEGKEITHINTHAIIIRNNGNKAATNVRVLHNGLPDFKIYPDTDYEINELPSGGKEIVIPRIIPKKEYTISYLYYPPLTYNQISSSIESDNSLAKIVNVQLQRIFPTWVNFLVGASMLLGLILFLYMVLESLIYIFS